MSKGGSGGASVYAVVVEIDEHVRMASVGYEGFGAGRRAVSIPVCHSDADIK